MWVIIFDEGNCNRAEALYASRSRSEINKKLKDLKEEYLDFISEYVEGDYLILKDNSAYYINEVIEILG